VIADLADFVSDFARGISLADARLPIATNVRSKELFRPGIGPHSESETVRLVLAELEAAKSQEYRGRFALGVPYVSTPRRRCDLCLGLSSGYEWAIEAKMVRLLGDNGKLNDNILMHVFSPYPEHRSALTDCDKLLASGLGLRKAILIYGYDSADWPLELAIDAFEQLASHRANLGRRHSAAFRELIHPIHRSGAVFAWEISQP
jgi:hypothetical protein